MVIPLKALGMISLAATGAAFLLTSGTAAADILELRCTNDANGSSWNVAIDLDHRRVDNLAAEIDGGSVRWRDPEHRTYELDRRSGALRMRNASSTGGYYLYYTCRPE